MPIYAHRLILISVLLLPLVVQARNLDVPLVLQQVFLQKQLDQQLFSAASGQMTVWDDGKGCNQLQLFEPRLKLEGGRLHTRSRAQARVGTALAGRCLSILDWNGFVEIQQVPALGIEPGTVRFRVVDSRVYADDGESAGVMGTIWGWVKQYAHPRFERLQVDINPLLTEVGRLVPLLYPDQPQPIRKILEDVRLTAVAAEQDGLQLTLGLDLPPQVLESSGVPEQSALTDAEMERWLQASRQWDAFLTHLIKQAGVDAISPDLRTDLLAVLIEARRDMLPILTGSGQVETDPVPELFVANWHRLEPVLRRLSKEAAPDSALHYAAFISAADILVTIQALEDQSGFSINADVLRHLARLANPEAMADPLQYDTAVDPELRRVFGFGPPLPPEPAEQDLPPGPQAAGMVRGAFAGLMLGVLPVMMLSDSHYKSLVERLNGWVPGIPELDEYLPLVQQLLDRTVGATLNNKNLDRKYLEIFRPLVLATAWQESCWRQYVNRNGEVIPIKSSAGAVGIMQVNQHVWRGFYDVDSLQHNVGYNAMAGTEIVHHYLVDYAIARAEDRHSGGIDNLARATYAMYNGGPAHRDRYRRDNVSRSLQRIDSAFWQKYQKVRQGNPLVVAECFTG